MRTNFTSVTETGGDEVTTEQIERLKSRYYWAKQYCKDKFVLEVACGTGQSLGFLNNVSKEFEAGDYSQDLLKIAKKYYGDRIQLSRFDAQNMPFKSKSKDVILLFEAIYYLPDAAAFVKECVRMLRPGGRVLISTANKDLYDFNPSPYSHRYYGVVELNQLFANHGFKTEIFGDSPLNKISTLQRVLRPIKKTAVLLNLIPKTMTGKKMLKRIVFGKLVKMPHELPSDLSSDAVFPRLSPDIPDTNHKIIFCAATLQK
jgi:SAM-dependent methyltransferase